MAQIEPLLRRLPSGFMERRTVVDDQLFVETWDDREHAVLAENERWRNEGVIKNRPDIHFELSLPEFTYYMMVRNNPDLESEDHDIKSRAWKRFIASDESKPYRVT
jgi:hypothetical protein